MKISNTEINNILGKYISGKDNYFKLFGGYNNELQATEVNEIPQKGEQAFVEMILDNSDFDFIHIELFKPTAKGVSRKSFFSKTIEFKKNKNQNNISTLGDIKDLGGLQGIMSAQINAATTNAKYETLAEQNNDLKGKVTKMEISLESLNTLNEQLKEQLHEKNSELNDLKRNYEWDIKRLKEEKNFAIEKADSDRKSADRFLTIGGQIAANLMGVNKDNLSGLLGGAFSQEGNEHNNTTQQIEFEQDYQGLKANAAKLADNIKKFMLDTIDANDEETAYSVIKKIHDVNAFMSKDYVNIEILNQFINQTHNDTGKN